MGALSLSSADEKCFPAGQYFSEDISRFSPPVDSPVPTGYALTERFIRCSGSFVLRPTFTQSPPEYLREPALRICFRLRMDRGAQACACLGAYTRAEGSRWPLETCPDTRSAFLTRIAVGPSGGGRRRQGDKHWRQLSVKPDESNTDWVTRMAALWRESAKASIGSSGLWSGRPKAQRYLHAGLSGVGVAKRKIGACSGWPDSSGWTLLN
jgi:hypothetical protein